jgi:hypothetical protein
MSKKGKTLNLPNNSALLKTNVMHNSYYLKSPTPAKIEEEFKAYMVAWKCQKGHINFQTIIGKDGTQHDICLKCGKHYEYIVE